VAQLKVSFSQQIGFFEGRTEGVRILIEGGALQGPVPANAVACVHRPKSRRICLVESVHPRAHHTGTAEKPQKVPVARDARVTDCAK